MTNNLSFEIRVPASTANLGPAFDTMGLALGLYLTVRGRRLPAGSDWRLTTTGSAPEGIPLRAEDNGICIVARWTALRLGVKLPPLELEIENDIPLGSGMGSSAAAIVAGISLVEAVTGRELDLDQFLHYAMVFEHHADNLAPSRLGGWITLCTFDHAAPYVFQRAWPEEIRTVIVRPRFELPTRTMRAVLPASLSRADAVFQMQRVLLLVSAIEDRRYDLLREAMRDRLHQPYRAPHVPGLEEILELRHPGLLATALSGAGPSILALVTDHDDEIAAAMTACVARQGREATVYQVPVDRRGRTIARREESS